MKMREIEPFLRNCGISRAFVTNIRTFQYVYLVSFNKGRSTFISKKLADMALEVSRYYNNATSIFIEKGCVVAEYGNTGGKF